MTEKPEEKPAEVKSPEAAKPAGPDPTIAYMTNALGSYVEAVYAMQSRAGMWSNVDSKSDYTRFFAELYSSLTRAYESYADNGADMTITWVNPMVDEVVPAGEGLPNGLPASLSDMVLAMFGFMRHLNVDMGALLVNMLKGRAMLSTAPSTVAGIEDAITDEGAGDEEDLDDEIDAGATEEPDPVPSA